MKKFIQELPEDDKPAKRVKKAPAYFPKPRKMIIHERVEDVDGWSLCGSLADTKAQIERLIAEHGPDARMDYEDYHDPYSNSERYHRHYVVVSREETDAEFNERLSREKKYAEEQLARDRKLLAELKARLGE